jgi:cyclin A
VYLRDRQAGEITKADRAELIESMHDFSRFYALALGTLHRAVSYVDRFLSVRKLDGGGGGQMLQNVGAAAVFVAAKYEDQGTLNEIDADDAAELAGSSRREVLAAERELVAALGYRLGGPTAHTFVDHLTRHAEQEEEYEGEVVVVRSLAHHLADMALLEYRCVGSLPSAVAASAIVLARLVLGYEPSSLCLVAGYALEDLSECVDAIYDMHEYMWAWPGCGRLMADWEGSQYSYSLPPRSTLTDLLHTAWTCTNDTF